MRHLSTRINTRRKGMVLCARGCDMPILPGMSYATHVHAGPSGLVVTREHSEHVVTEALDKLLRRV